MDKHETMWASCLTCGELYAVDFDSGHVGYCSEKCYEDREGSCTCHLGNPPCSYCCVDYDPTDYVGTVDDIFLDGVYEWRFKLASP